MKKIMSVIKSFLSLTQNSGALEEKIGKFDYIKNMMALQKQNQH